MSLTVRLPYLYVIDLHATIIVCWPSGYQEPLSLTLTLPWFATINFQTTWFFVLTYRLPDSLSWPADYLILCLDLQTTSFFVLTYILADSLSWPTDYLILCLDLHTTWFFVLTYRLPDSLSWPTDYHDSLPLTYGLPWFSVIDLRTTMILCHWPTDYHVFDLYSTIRLCFDLHSTMILYFWLSFYYDSLMLTFILP